MYNWQRLLVYRDFFTLKQTAWEDIRSPATAVNLPGAAGDPTRDTGTGLLDFVHNSTELLYILHQMPHGWKEGSAISPHVHWAKTTSAAGNVAWRLRYKHWPIGSVIDAAWTDLGESDTPVAGTPDNDTADEHLITGWSDISMTGYTISHCILYELSRVGGSGDDTYGADARMIEFDTHIRMESLGSNRLYKKEF